MKNYKKDLGTDLFGRPVREPTQEDIENLLRPMPKTEQKKPGFTYIPELKVHVADELSIYGKNWFECKKELPYRNSRMLTPAEFWIYYDYCIKNRPDIIENSFCDSNQIEWFDAVIKTKIPLLFKYPAEDIYSRYAKARYYKRHFVVSANLENLIPQNNSAITGITYKNKHLKCSNGHFNRENVDSETGLPKVLGIKEGEFVYYRYGMDGDEAWLNGELLALIRGFDFEKEEKISLGLFVPQKGLPNIGVREVKDII